MSDAEFLASLKRDFLEEAKLELESLEANLLEFENSGDSEALSDFKRRVHSMKGSSGAIGLEDLYQVLHDYESWLEKAKTATAQERSSLVTPSLKFVDVLREWIAAVGTPSEATHLKCLAESYR